VVLHLDSEVREDLRQISVCIATHVRHIAAPGGEDTSSTVTAPRRSLAVIALTETAQFCSSKVLTAWLRH